MSVQNRARCIHGFVQVNRVIKPLQHPQLYRSNLVRQVKGVLLYGPPGTGKTMLAKVLCSHKHLTSY